MLEDRTISSGADGQSGTETTPNVARCLGSHDPETQTSSQAYNPPLPIHAIVTVPRLLSRLIHSVAGQRARLAAFFALLLVNGSIAAGGFFTTVALANHMGTTTFGQLAYAFAIGSIIAVAVRFGLDRSLLRELAEKPEQRATLLTSSLLLRLVLLVVSLSLLQLLRYSGRVSIDLPSGAMVVILACALEPLQIANLFDIWEKQALHAACLATQKLTYFSLIWLAILYAPERLDLAWVGTSQLLSVLLFLVLQFYIACRELRHQAPAPSLVSAAGGIVHLLRHSFWLFLASVGILGMTALNNVVIKAFAGFDQLGVYAACWQILSLATLFLKNLSRIGRPILARLVAATERSLPLIRRFLRVYCAGQLAAISLVAIPAIVAPGPILRFVFSVDYGSGASVLRAFGLYMLVRAVETVYGQLAVLLRLDRTVLFASLCAGAVGILTSLALLPHIYALGAALALLAGEVVLLVVYWFATNRALDPN